MRKRILLVPILLLLLLRVYSLALAQGPITYPPETEVVRGIVDIQGTADHANFWKYELAAAPFGTQNWFNIGVSEAPVHNGVLARWNTTTVPDGTYTIRLRIVKKDGNYDEYTVQRVLVANSLPTDTPTPEVSPSPTVTPTSEPPTATPVVVTPDIPTPTPAPPGAATPPAGSSLSDNGGDNENTLGSLVARSSQAFLRGARTVLLVFLTVGFFFAVKNLLTWLYFRFLA